MQIADTKEVAVRQDILSVSRKGTTRTDTVKKAVDKETDEKYVPSKEGLELLKILEQEKQRLRQGNIAKTGKEKSPVDDMVKAMRIARNIMRGKIVPPQDEFFLQRFSDELYQAAKNIAMLKEQKEKVESELEEEEDGSFDELVRALRGNESSPASVGNTGSTNRADSSDSSMTETAEITEV